MLCSRGEMGFARAAPLLTTDDDAVQLITLGNSAVGKTSLLSKFTDRELMPSMIATLVMRGGARWWWRVSTHELRGSRQGVDVRVRYVDIDGVRVKVCVCVCVSVHGCVYVI